MAKLFKLSVLVPAALLIFVLLSCVWGYALLYAPIDAQQGEVYKILYAHVPAAATSLFALSIVLLIAGIYGLVRAEESALRFQRAAVECGLIFTVITLATGSIWGRPTWGTWWTWDARLTTTLLLAILQAAYLLLFQGLAPGTSRVRACSILAIAICVDVPIIYQSVKWWRTLHQPATIIEQRGRTMDPTMLNILLAATILSVIYGLLLWGIRVCILKREAKIEEHTARMMSQGSRPT